MRRHCTTGSNFEAVVKIDEATRREKKEEKKRLYFSYLFVYSLDRGPTIVIHKKYSGCVLRCEDMNLTLL